MSQEYEIIQERRTQYGIRLLFGPASTYLLMGELEKCRQAAELLLRESQSAGLLLLQGWGHYLLARMMLEWNELAVAADHYQAVVENRYTVNMICAQESLAGRAHTLRARGQPAPACQVVELYNQFQPEQSGPAGDGLLSLQAWLAFMDGQKTPAQRWAEAYDVPSPERSMIWFQLPHLYKAYILVALGKKETINQAGPLLDELEHIAECTHNIPLMIRLLILRAIWLDLQNRMPQALLVLRQAVEIAQPGHFCVASWSMARA